MNRVSGKVALVTGGAMGIGCACCELLAREGASVLVTDREVEAGAEVAKTIRASGGRGLRAHDVSSEPDWIRVIDEARRAFDKLDILVNNAGVGRFRGRRAYHTRGLGRALLAVNLDGVFLGIKHAIAPMREAGGGSIVNLSSIEGLVGDPALAAYNASKGAVRLLTKSAALYCAKGRTGIRVNSVHPGYIWTPMVSTQPRRQVTPKRCGERSRACIPWVTWARRWMSLRRVVSRVRRGGVRYRSRARNRRRVYGAMKIESPVTQRDTWIDPRRPVCRQQSRRCRDDEQNRERAGEACRIAPRHAEQ